MYKLSIITLLCLCFCNAPVFADDAPKSVVQGNQGYIYGTPPKVDATAMTTSDVSTTAAHPIGDIIHAIEKLDAWIQKNLW